jgi:hypothetical protein
MVLFLCCFADAVASHFVSKGEAACPAFRYHVVQVERMLVVTASSCACTDPARKLKDLWSSSIRVSSLHKHNHLQRGMLMIP